VQYQPSAAAQLCHGQKKTKNYEQGKQGISKTKETINLCKQPSILAWKKQSTCAQKSGLWKSLTGSFLEGSHS